MQNYNIIKIKYHKKEYYAIWYTLEQEGVLCDGANRMLAYSNKQKLISDAHAHSIDVGVDIIKEYDLDALEEYISDEDSFATPQTLDCWSLFCDIAFSTKASFAGDGASFMLNDIYEKLCMSAIDTGDAFENQCDDSFDLTDEEEELTKSIMKTGITVFLKNTVFID